MRLAQEQQRQGRFKGGGFVANPAEQEVYPVVDPSRATPPPVAHVATTPVAGPPASLYGNNVPGYNSVGGSMPVYPGKVSDRSSPPSYEREGRQKKKAPGKSTGWSSPSSRDSSSSYRGNSSDATKKQKSKLPHGLTVQELKEMTKARLQAEASDNGDDSLIKRPSDSRGAPVVLSEPRTAPSPTPPPYRESWNPEPRAEAWETASASTANSDAFPNADFHGDLNFTRARSYTDSQGEVFPQQGSGPALYNHSGSSPFYDHSMGFAQNRRRAATLSPRLGLSHVQEDYPVNVPIPFPSFSGPAGRAQGPPGLQARSVAPTYCASSSFGYPTNANPPVSHNRPRTSSAVSLPPMSHTADEFDLDPSRRSSPFDVVREDSVTPGLSDVFRDNRFSPVRSMMDGLGLYSDNRARAATWSDSLMGSASPGELSDDLASLLKLAGPDE
eukprot:scaffold10909_cov172-Amphora_coffeaeformis.AAC.5